MKSEKNDEKTESRTPYIDAVAKGKWIELTPKDIVSNENFNRFYWLLMKQEQMTKEEVDFVRSIRIKLENLLKKLSEVSK